MFDEMVGFTLTCWHVTTNPPTFGEGQLHCMAGEAGEEPRLSQIDDDSGSVDEHPAYSTIQCRREGFMGIELHTVDGLAHKHVRVERFRISGIGDCAFLIVLNPPCHLLKGFLVPHDLSLIHI